MFFIIVFFRFGGDKFNYGGDNGFFWRYQFFSLVFGYKILIGEGEISLIQFISLLRFFYLLQLLQGKENFVEWKEYLLSSYCVLLCLLDG